MNDANKTGDRGKRGAHGAGWIAAGLAGSGSLLWAAGALLIGGVLGRGQRHPAAVQGLLGGGLALLALGFVAGLAARRTRAGRLAVVLALLSPGWLALGLWLFSIDPYPVGSVRAWVARDLPVGTPRARVAAWARAHGFSVAPDGGRLDAWIEGTHGDLVCSYNLMITFDFDRAGRLAGDTVRQDDVCL